MSLNISNIDALHWAEEFCKTCKEQGITEIEIDFIMGWFANYRFAVSDPLDKKIADLEISLKSVRSEAFGWAYADEDYRQVDVPSIHAKALADLEISLKSVRSEAFGWAYADACAHLDENKDYRQVDVPSIHARALADLG